MVSCRLLCGKWGSLWAPVSFSSASFILISLFPGGGNAWGARREPKETSTGLTGKAVWLQLGEALASLCPVFAKEKPRSILGDSDWGFFPREGEILPGDVLSSTGEGSK